MKTSVIVTILVIVLLLIGGLYFLRPAPDATQTAADRFNQEIGDNETEDEDNVYQVVTADSEVRYRVNKVPPVGGPLTVVGTSPDVAGSLTIEDDRLTSANIIVNAREFTTDSSQRDGLVVREVFQADDDANEFISFRVTTPVVIAAGDIEIPGILTVAGVDYNVTFNGDITMVDDEVTMEVTTNTTLADLGVTTSEVTSVVPDGQLILSGTIVARR